MRSGRVKKIYVVQLFTEKGTIAKEIEAGGIVERSTRLFGWSDTAKAKLFRSLRGECDVDRSESLVKLHEFSSHHFSACQMTWFWSGPAKRRKTRSPAFP
jgi:hypothetical protein